MGWAGILSFGGILWMQERIIAGLQEALDLSIDG